MKNLFCDSENDSEKIYEIIVIFYFSRSKNESNTVQNKKTNRNNKKSAKKRIEDDFVNTKLRNRIVESYHNLYIYLYYDSII